MELTVVDPADRDDEFVAHSAPERARLYEGEVVRIRRHAAADEARLSQYESSVVLITQAHRFSQTDYVEASVLFASCRCFPARTRVRRTAHYSVRDSMTRLMGAWIIRCPMTVRTVTCPVRRADRRKPCRELLLDHFGVRGCQRILCRQTPLRPGSRLVR